MTETNTEQLKKLFHQEMIELYKKVIKVVKYKPTRLMDYINRYGGYEAAVKYISTESNVQDFAVLWEKEHLELSVEALITKEEYRVLFNEDILNFCDRKLKEYSYAPNKIEEIEEPSGYVDEKEEEKIDLAELLKQKDLYLKRVKKKEYPIYQKGVGISVEEWKGLLTDPKIVTANNLDLLLRIYEIGDEVGPNDLAAEEGYSTTYPYKEVATALGKRVRMALKIEAPVGEDGKPILWHILFNGGLKDNSAFEWSLKNHLRTALKELIDQGTINPVEVKSKKEIQHVEEEIVIKKVESPEENKNTLSDFDRLFEAIMGESTPKAETKPAVEKVPVVPTEVKSVEKTPVIQAATSQQTAEVKGSKEVVEKISKPVKTPDQIVEMPIHDLVKQETSQVTNEQTMAVPVESAPQENDFEHKKQACIDYYGAICDICGFDFGYTYGEAYESCIEVHNIHNEKEEISETTDPIADLIPICCNCHRIIHSQVPMLSIEKIRKMVKA